MSDLQELRIPHMGSVENARLVAWHVDEGAEFAVGQLLYEVETDKTLTDVSAIDAGVLVRRAAGEGEELKVGDLVGWWVQPGTGQEAIAAALTLIAEPSSAARASVREQSGAGSKPHLGLESRDGQEMPDGKPGAGLSPRVRQLARENGVELTTLRGSGPGGRITGEDVLQAAAQHRATPVSAASGEPARPAGYETLPCEARPNSLRRRTIARRLAESARTMPQLTADMQVDLGNLLAARSRLNAAEQAAGRASVSVLSFVAAAVCRLLPQHAELNATYADTHMLLWRVVNLGVAVDTPEGLVVPVLRDAGRLSLPELNAAITALASRARAGELRAEELEGGTFTISNPGSLGPVLRAQAILNPPQVALLGLPGMRRAPVAIDDGSGGYCVEVRPLLCPSLTFDHRALDGGQVIRFLNALKEELECRPG